MHALIQLNGGTFKTFPLSWPMKSKVKQIYQNLISISGHINFRVIQIPRPPQNYRSYEGSQDLAIQLCSLNTTQLWREQLDPDQCDWYSLEPYSKQAMRLHVITLKLAPVIPTVRPLLIDACLSRVSNEKEKFWGEVAFKATYFFAFNEENSVRKQQPISWLPSVTTITFSVFPGSQAPTRQEAAGYLVWVAAGFWLLPAPSVGAPAGGCAVSGSPGRSPSVPASCRWVSAGLALQGFKGWREMQVSNNLENDFHLGFG